MVDLEYWYRLEYGRWSVKKVFYGFSNRFKVEIVVQFRKKIPHFGQV